MRKIIIIIDPLITDEDSWEMYLASLLHGYIESSNLEDKYLISTVTDLSLIKQYIQTKYITSEDIIIFPNAWGSAPVYVKHWCENYKINPETLGFWSRGCYINQDEEFRPLGDRNWRKVHERASFRCLDKSFFISEFHKEQFRIYVSKYVFPERLNIIPFPLDYLDIEVLKYKNQFYKQNMLIFPWSKYTTLHEQIMYDFIRVYPDMQIIFAQQHSTLTRSQILTQMSKAKVAFLPYNSPNIGNEIYECLLLGTIPLVPDIEGLKDMVPDEFRYPVEWTENIFNYSKYAPDLVSKIKDLVYNYDANYKKIVQDQAAYNFEHFYDSKHFIDVIFGNNKRN